MVSEQQGGVVPGGARHRKRWAKRSRRCPPSPRLSVMMCEVGQAVNSSPGGGCGVAGWLFVMAEGGQVVLGVGIGG
ncbi:hypothetical protein Dimus_030384 [Dionaea muscipula]